VGTMPIPLRYGGAHTLRLSGDWKINMQNLPSGRDGSTPVLRNALRAPPGHQCVVADLASIEARLTAWFTRAPLLESYQRGEDAYKVMAAAIFNTSVEAVTKVQRFVGKSAILGLGFGLGKDNFYLKTGVAARAQGLEIGDLWTPALAARTVDTYRKMQAPTKTMWELLEQRLQREWAGLAAPVTLGPITIGHRGYGYVTGPGGCEMRYENVRQGGYEIWYSHNGRIRKIYGAAFLENIIQFLARILLFEAALRLKAAGMVPVHTTHDELVFVSQDHLVDTTKQKVFEELTRPPKWAPDLPLDASVGSGVTYGGAK
jgi:DNA polymerase family A